MTLQYCTFFLVPRTPGMYVEVTLAASPPQQLQRTGMTETHHPINEIDYLDGPI